MTPDDISAKIRAKVDEIRRYRTDDLPLVQQIPNQLACAPCIDEHPGIHPAGGKQHEKKEPAPSPGV